MKKVAILFLAIFVGMQLWAQSESDYLELARSVLKTEKKAVVAEAMEFTDAEADVFWPLYNEYSEAEYLILTKRMNIVKDFANNYETLSNEKADELWTSSLKFEQELLNLQKKYYKKFKKVLPAGKAARFFQVENKINTLIDAELSLEIPLIDVE